MPWNWTTAGRRRSCHLPEAHVLAPASFFGCRASLNSFSFIWLNPPFDDSYGGCRVEEQFLRTATDWLVPGGVMALVCPEDVVDEYSDARRHFTIYYENCMIVPFPEAHRPFHEVIVFGQKRVRPEVDRWRAGCWKGWESVEAPKDFRYHIPPGNGPRIFQKIEPTETELQDMLITSPSAFPSDSTASGFFAFAAVVVRYRPCGLAAGQWSSRWRGPSGG